jgi:hypothetical protein
VLCVHHRGKISCRRLWQIGLEHGPGDGDGDGYYGGGDGYGNGASDMGGVAGLQQKGICTWLSKGSGELARGGGNGGSTGLWVNVFDSGSPQPGRVMLTMSRTQRELPPGAGDLGGGVGRGAGGDDAGGQSKATLKVSSCQAYDYILLAALRSQVRVHMRCAFVLLLLLLLLLLLRRNVLPAPTARPLVVPPAGLC